MRRCLALPFLVALSCFLLLPPAAAAEKLVTAAGAGYKRMVEDLAQAFTAASGLEVERIYGNMGQVTAQAQNSGLVDCVIGDRSFLEKSGLEFADMAEIGRGKLVIATALGVRLKEPADVTRAVISRLAMPDPEKAIYGRAADEFLRNAGLAEAVKDKLLVVAAVPQVSSYVVSKEVDAGFINLTDALALGDKVGQVLPVDQKYYSPIRIVAGPLAKAPDPKALEAFLRFLKTDAAKDIAARHGL